MIKKVIHKIHEKSKNDEEYIAKAIEEIRGCLDRPIDGCVDTDSIGLSVEEAEALRKIYVNSKDNQ